MLWCSCIGCHHGFICQRALSVHAGPASQSSSSTITPVSTATPFITASHKWNNSPITPALLTTRSPCEKYIEEKNYWIKDSIVFACGILIGIVITFLLVKTRDQPFPSEEFPLTRIGIGSNPNPESNPPQNPSTQSPGEPNILISSLLDNTLEISRTPTGSEGRSGPRLVTSRGGSGFSGDPGQVDDAVFNISSVFSYR